MLIYSLYQEIGDELNLGVLSSVFIIQRLWSGYGELVRLKFTKKTIIIKHVKLPKASKHPKGWNTDFSHQRKLYSYEVEVNWYKEFSEIIDNRCRIPQGLKTFQTENEWLIVMEDLAMAGFNITTCHGHRNYLISSINWLANFHAKYLNTKSELIWEIGTYWHLDTRPDEFEILEDKELKKYAIHIDNELKNIKYKTIVHGDAKIANFCFDEHGTTCAAVDFQYVGHGTGMKDLVYFISSAVEPEVCDQMESWILDTYFIAFKDAIEHYHPKLDSIQIEREWRPLFAIAWADFQRFIKAWSPNHYKINSYSEELTTRAIAYLKAKA
ncbi:MAG: phosphotransferase [Arcobacter sp.]|nr:MAG: phosphotransferase [Arcobacter sp.]